MAVLPAEIPTGLVTGQFYFVSADLADSNTDPEMETVTGVVRFTSSAPFLRMPTKQATLIPLCFDAKLNAKGELVSAADPSVGLRLPRTDSDLINPVDYTWQVDFLLSREPYGHTIKIPSFHIKVPAAGTDLTEVMPIAVSNGIQIIQGARGEKGEDSTVPGPKGAGVPDGGTSGQLIRKGTSTTEWVTPTKALVGLGNVDNTADTNKPVSTPQKTALDAKAPLASPVFTGTPTGIAKAHVGLGNVDNTSDANKPVSTATAAAIKDAGTAMSPYGTYAARPAHTAVNVGAVYYAHDTQESYRATATGWVAVGAAGTNLATAKSTAYFVSATADTFQDVPGLTATFMAGTRPLEIEAVLDMASVSANGAVIAEMLLGTRVVQEIIDFHPQADKWTSYSKKVTIPAADFVPGQTYTAKVRVKGSIGQVRVDGGLTKPAELTVTGR